MSLSGDPALLSVDHFAEQLSKLGVDTTTLTCDMPFAPGREDLRGQLARLEEYVADHGDAIRDLTGVGVHLRIDVDPTCDHVSVPLSQTLIAALVGLGISIQFGVMPSHQPDSTTAVGPT